jgi:hypothetical protein
MDWNVSSTHRTPLHRDREPFVQEDPEVDDTAAWVLKSRRLEEEAKKKQIAEAAKKAAQLNAMDEEAEAEDSDDEAVQKKRSACQPPHLTLDMLARSSVSAEPFLDESNRFLFFQRRT